MTRVLQQDVEYVDVRPGPDRHEPTSFYEKWTDQSSAKHASPELIAADALRKLYPGYSLVVSDDHRVTSLLTLPGITVHPLDSQEAKLDRVSNVVFRQIPAHTGAKVAGSLVDDPIVVSHKLVWNNSDFVVHVTKFQNANLIKTVHFILHDGPEQRVRDLLLATFLYAEQTHDEVWVFNRGFWSKDKSLWLGIKHSSWDDVIMKEDSKKVLQRDIYGFFKSEITYKKLAIPWKRGLIMYGPPGNGKTISIKVVMKTCTERGFTPLYVKSFKSPQGEEVTIQNVFLKTRQLAPCVLILEDIDSLINDQNRSFFLNQLDGLEGNDGLLVIASTNHFDRLDTGLSNRPSRFDRKYLFDDPDHQERVLYAKYWQKKLKDNDKLSFPASLVEEVAELTDGFSFAYLKEAFVSTLVRITNADEDERVEFAVMLENQIMTLRKELGEPAPLILPHLPNAHPEKGLHKQVLHAKQQPTTSQADTFSSQRSRGSMQPPLPIDASADISDGTMSLPAIHACKRRANRSKCRTTEKVSGTEGMVPSGTPFLQGVLHAPLSAYPQVMPGSLPTVGPEPVQHPIHWPSTSKGCTSGVDICEGNSVDHPALIEIDDAHVEDRLYYP